MIQQIKKYDLENMSCMVAVRENSERHYDSANSILHGLGHLIAAGLTNDGMMMDYEKTSKIKPLYQAGLEAEYIANIYHRVLGDFSSDEFELMTKKPAEYNKWLLQEANNSFDNVAIENKQLIEGMQIENYEELLQDENKNKNHLKGMQNYSKKYTQQQNYPMQPSIEELVWHAEKAAKICCNIYEKYGKFPIEIGQRIEELPLKAFSIDNISPWDIQQQNQRTLLYREYYRDKPHDLTVNL